MWICLNIHWLNTMGKYTYDENPIVGRVRCKQYRHLLGRRSNWEGKWSQWYNICAEHAKQLSQPDMQDWEFEPIATK